MSTNGLRERSRSREPGPKPERDCRGGIYNLFRLQQFESSNGQKTSVPHIGPGQQQPTLRAPTAIQAFANGTRVWYFSKQISDWTEAEVRGYDQQTDCYELDIMARAHSWRITPRTSDQKPDPLHTLEVREKAAATTNGLAKAWTRFDKIFAPPRAPEFDPSPRKDREVERKALEALEGLHGISKEKAVPIIPARSSHVPYLPDMISMLSDDKPSEGRTTSIAARATAARSTAQEALENEHRKRRTRECIVVHSQDPPDPEWRKQLIRECIEVNTQDPPEVEQRKQLHVDLVVVPSQGPPENEPRKQINTDPYKHQNWRNMDSFPSLVQASSKSSYPIVRSLQARLVGERNIDLFPPSPPLEAAPLSGNENHVGGPTTPACLLAAPRFSEPETPACLLGAVTPACLLRGGPTTAACLAKQSAPHAQPLSARTAPLSPPLDAREWIAKNQDTNKVSGPPAVPWQKEPKGWNLGGSEVASRSHGSASASSRPAVVASQKGDERTSPPRNVGKFSGPSSGLKRSLGRSPPWNNGESQWNWKNPWVRSRWNWRKDGGGNWPEWSGDKEEPKSKKEKKVKKDKKIKHRHLLKVHGPAPGEPFPPSMEGFYLFMCERERMRIKREKGHSPPYTKDRIMESVRLANVKREHDRTGLAIARLLNDHKHHFATHETNHAAEDHYCMQERISVASNLVLSVAIWRLFGSVDFICRTGCLNQPESEVGLEELKRHVLDIAVDVWSNGFHACTDAYEPSALYHALEMAAWLRKPRQKTDTRKSFSKRKELVTRLWEAEQRGAPVEMQRQLRRALVCKSGKRYMRAAYNCLLDGEHSRLQQLHERCKTVGAQLCQAHASGPTWKVPAEELCRIPGFDNEHGIFSAEIIRDFFSTPLLNSCSDLDRWVPIGTNARRSLARIFARGPGDQEPHEEQLMEELRQVFQRRRQLWPAQIEHVSSVSLHLPEVQAMLGQFETYLQARDGVNDRSVFRRRVNINHAPRHTNGDDKLDPGGGSDR